MMERVKNIIVQIGFGKFNCIRMDKIDREDLGKEIHNQVIGWTGNCDTKASILIAFIGIFASILFTSDYILNTLQKIVQDFFKYWQVGEGEFSLINAFVIFTLFLFLFSVSYAVLALFRVISGKIECNEESVIFFGKIEKNTFEEYYHQIELIKKETLLKDGYRQIYNCSKRCSEKFIDYNKAVCAIKWGLLFLVLFMICLILSNSIQ